MPIRTLERRWPRLGFISAGHQTVSKKGNIHPTSTETITVHSDAPEKLEPWAAHYGGDVVESPTSTERQERFYVVTETRELPVVVPSDDFDLVCSQWYEAWAASGLVRRCDGLETVLWRQPPAKGEKVGALSDEITPCICTAEGLEGDEACKPIVRLNVIPSDVWSDIPDIGVWTVRSAGILSNVELKGDLELLHNLLGSVGSSVPLLLRLELANTRRGLKPKFRLGLRASPRHALELAAGGRPALELPTVDAPALPDGDDAVGSYIEPRETVAEAPPATDATPASTPGSPADDDAEPAPSSVRAPLVIGHLEVTPVPVPDGEPHTPADRDSELRRDAQLRQAWKELDRVGLTHGALGPIFQTRYGFSLDLATKQQMQATIDWLKEQQPAQVTA